MKPGTYNGKICGCTIDIVGEKQTACFKIKFDIKYDEDQRFFSTWQGWCSDKVNEKTGKTYTQLAVDKIVSLGFKGNDLTDMASQKPVGDLFDTEKEYEVVVEYQKDINGNETKYLQVRFINTWTKPPMNKIVEITHGLSLPGELARARQEQGSGEVDNEALPF